MLFLRGFILKPTEKAYDLLKIEPGVIFKIVVLWGKELVL